MFRLAREREKTQKDALTENDALVVFASLLLLLHKPTTIDKSAKHLQEATGKQQK